LVIEIAQIAGLAEAVRMLCMYTGITSDYAGVKVRSGEEPQSGGFFMHRCLSSRYHK